MAEAENGEAIDSGEALLAGGANAVGLGFGQVISRPARALSTSATVGEAGIPVVSNRGPAFMIGSAPES